MPTRGGKTTGERGKKMRTYELKYSRSLGSFVELKQAPKVIDRIPYRGPDKQQHEKYKELGYTEKISDIIRVMRETLQDTPAGEKNKGFKNRMQRHQISSRALARAFFNAQKNRMPGQQIQRQAKNTIKTPDSQ